MILTRLLPLIAACCLTPLAFAAKVNINTADAPALADMLIGVGPSKAEAIVKYRSEHGPFKSTDELSEVAGIGPATVERNKERIALEDEKSTTPPTPASPAPAP